MLTQRCLENLNKIAACAPGKPTPTNLGDDLLLEFFNKIADEFIPISNHAGRFEKAKYLIWHFGNLLPAVQADLTEFVLERWPQDLDEKQEPMAFTLPPADGRTLSGKEPAPSGPLPSGPEQKAVISRLNTNPLQKTEQDWFDTLLNWMAVLANLLPLRA